MSTRPEFRRRVLARWLALLSLTLWSLPGPTSATQDPPADDAHACPDCPSAVSAGGGHRLSDGEFGALAPATHAGLRLLATSAPAAVSSGNGYQLRAGQLAVITARADRLHDDDFETPSSLFRRRGATDTKEAP